MTGPARAAVLALALAACGQEAPPQPPAKEPDPSTAVAKSDSVPAGCWRAWSQTQEDSLVLCPDLRPPAF